MELNFITIVIMLVVAVGLVYFGVILGQRSRTARTYAAKIRSESDSVIEDLRRKLREAQAKLQEYGESGG